MLAEFLGTARPMHQVAGDGDVKYHLGYANTRPTVNGKNVKLSLVPNPSHLPVVTAAGRIAAPE